MQMSLLGCSGSSCRFVQKHKVSSLSSLLSPLTSLLLFFYLSTFYPSTFLSCLHLTS